MKPLNVLCCALFLSTTILVAQVPTPQSTRSTTNGPSWKKTSELDYTLRDASGKIISNVQDLLYLDTETLSVMDMNSRDIYLLENFKEAATGATGSARILRKNLKKNFFITNPNSFGHFVNDQYVSGPFCNIEGSYVYYVAEENTTFLLKDIRKYENWGADSTIKLDYSPSHTYWYRDVEGGEYGIIEKGETLDYDRVSSDKDGNDLVISWDGNKKYVLEGYYTTASFVFKPIKMYEGSSGEASVSSPGGCVKGDCENGWGKYEYNGGYYDGFWQDGKKQGYGLYKWDDTGKYIGDWNNDTMEGYGVYIAANEDNIIGQYQNGQLNGLGITVTGDKWEQGIFSDGSIVTSYEFITNEVSTGCTAGDCQNKYGRFKWDNGDSFTGFFKNGNLYLGTYTFANGGKYSGMFNSDNQFHGMGRYFFEDDAYYGGQWKNGKYHGRGYYHNKDLEQQIGVWENGTLIRSLKN